MLEVLLVFFFPTMKNPIVLLLFYMLIMLKCYSIEHV